MIRINSIKFKNTGFDKLPDKDVREKELNLMLLSKAAKLLKVDSMDIAELRIRKHSIDARKKPEIFDVYMVDVILKKGLNEEKVVKKSSCKNAQIVKDIVYRFPANRKEDALKKRNQEPIKPIIVGAGPGGLFCAYELALAGFSPIVIERGMDVDNRLKAVEDFWSGKELNPKGNVQFGEGGAGTFSDGKLNTMVKDKDGRGRECLSIFVKNGAPREIMYESKPHIGTDILRDVVKNMRKEITRRGGKFLFEITVTELILENGKVSGVKCDTGETFSSPVVVLAIGHSARDTFKMLFDSGIEMTPKAFAVGLRVEHPQEVINESQYGIGDPASLPPTPYKVTANLPSGRGVYSFCMCPGGYVVNASSEDKRLAVNGMSYSDRSGKNANSAIIVTISPEDYGNGEVLSGIEFQRKLEEKAYEIGSGKVPVEYFDDFKDGIRCLEDKTDDSSVLKSIEKHGKENRNKPCIKGEYEFSPVHRILPLELSKSIALGMESFGRMIKGFDSDEALFSGVESRTSSPVRIVRDENLEANGIMGLYPCGEGAGYAGGITSAAMDGMKIAEQISIHYNSGKTLYRNSMINKRKTLPSHEKEKLDIRISDKVFSLDAYKKARNILIFCGTNEEINTDIIIKDALSQGKNVYCPRITDKKNHNMVFARIKDLSELTVGAYRIREPISTGKDDIYKADKDTLMILPGLIFDNKGNRIGYGAGYYDRYLESLGDKSMVKAGICYHFQFADDMLDEYMNDNDENVQLVVTDKEIVKVE
ncbi:MAG: 5-formyltetrahydrofolate cyclo-ligase [Butyrivibrio sp.]|nr:5-formyltetrahydrofolate cyclo-ligase [Butyrivibrio sp.]